MLRCTVSHLAITMRHILVILFNNMNLFINRLQVHVCQSSTVADHCRTFALSDPDNASFRGECDHLHYDTCDRCAFLHSALAEVESALAVEMENLTEDEKVSK